MANARSTVLLQLDLGGINPFPFSERATGGPAASSIPNRELIERTERLLSGIKDGSLSASTLTLIPNGGESAGASATVTLTSVVATNALSINGSALTAVASGAVADQFNVGGNDTITATNLAAAIQAGTTNALVRQHAFASNFAQTITFGGLPAAGTIVNINGWQFQAVAQVRDSLASVGNFLNITSATATATALVNAINAHPVAKHFIWAQSSAGVVTVRQRRGTASLGLIILTGIPGVTPTNTTLGGNAFVAGTTVLVSARMQGVSGNAVTIAQTSGATMSVSSARLVGGVGGLDGSVHRTIVLGQNSNALGE